MSFQDFSSFTYSMLESLHDMVMIWLSVIILVVVFVGVCVFTSFKSGLSSDSLTLEMTWTLVPVFILMLVALPSLWLLCFQDSLSKPFSSTIKVLSNQWNWQSESEDLFDHLLDSDSTDIGTSMEVPLSVKSGNEARVITISTDVLHSLGIPSMGIKLDAAPGRMSATVLEGSFPGLFQGSCYELCGSGHSSMPISILVIFSMKS